MMYFHQRGGTSDSLVDWRMARLRHAGLPRQQAARIAADCAYDLHALLELIDRGCPAELAARIVAPLGERETPC
jgi:hypothetical protein